ncbi:MAG: amylo-alpha-1,6-glucosidase [Phycisphaerales bacterium]
MPDPRPTSALAIDPLPIDALADRLALPHAAETEWVLTNALGGFAMGTATGLPTRRYHGHLVAAMSPPVRRVLALGPIAESVILDPDEPDAKSRAIHVQPFHFAGEPEPSDAPRPVRFERSAEGWCRWTYAFDAERSSGGSARVRLVRTLTLADGRNAASIRYELTTDAPVRLELRPITPLRDMHDLIPPGDPAPELSRSWTDASGDPWALVARGDAGLTLHASASEGTASFRAEAHTWHGLSYAWETRRGMDDTEDAPSPGVFEVVGDGALDAQLDASADARTPADTHEPEPADASPRAERRRSMIAAARDACPTDDLYRAQTIARLACAADDFVVHSSAVGTDGRSIIAGYPWFADWGRDSMIALPGLLLLTGRHDEAFGVLDTFGRARKNGLIPNRFDDDAGPAHYNTADASLWYVHACTQYLHASGDTERYLDALAPACAEIIEAHTDGTDYKIGMDPDDWLVRAGDTQTQLTWMDAKRDGVCFTPRHGKPVEINALWHNALGALADGLESADPACAASLRQTAERVAASFRKMFANGPEGGLVDCLTPEGNAWRASTELRPNQVFAVSLPHAPLDADTQRRVVRVVREHLLTPVGLRTLAPDDPGYRPRFEGPLFERDAAYHNGTVWPWLMGPYVEALLRSESFSNESRAQARRLLDALARELDHNGLGQMWEVYDADEPREPDGCVAQAWSVAELLRGYALAG